MADEDDVQRVGGVPGTTSAEEARLIDALVAAVRAGDPVTARVRAADVEQDARWAALAREARASTGTTSNGASTLAVEILVEDLDATGTVRHFVRRSLLDADAVDDVAQDTLVSVASSIGTFTGGSKVTTWVHRIAQRRVVDHLRRLRSVDPLPDGDVGPAARISSMIATRVTVRDAVDRLPPLYREPVSLRDLDGLEYAEIARRLDRSVGTVKSQIARGRAIVATSIGDLA